MTLIPMDTNTLRNNVVKLYPGPNWAKRVSKMSDAQVYAIWTKHQSQQTTKNETSQIKEPDTQDEQPF